jgi:uncharacterized protein YcaQ
MSGAQARRVALAAQGFGLRPTIGTAGTSHPSSVGTRQLNLAMQRLGVLQIDSVNVFERSHYLPLFARLGPYDKALLDKLTLAKGSPYVEYWAHQAAFVPMADWPLWGWRRRYYREVRHQYVTWAQEHRQMMDFVLEQVREHGPITAGQIEHEENKRTDPWWGWSEVKTALEVLFDRGDVVASHRKNFERFYDLPERAIPAPLLEREVPEDDAVRELVRISARALGVGTVKDIADYFRMLQAPVKTALDELVDEGEVHRVQVEGWGKAPAYLHRDARMPRRIETAALLSPFDPVVWERERTLRMFGFHYRIEIYTPAPKRKFGYYTLPLLIDEALVGRIDLKTDRQAGVLRVQSAWREGDAAVDLERVAGLLRSIADWQGMDRVEVMGRGDLAKAVAGALGVAMLAPPTDVEPAVAAPEM